ncbi:MAG: WG repeat-containing protein, partial [Anaerotignum sp.]|nr:WG repeat-containing protein [Anaerotignum sp.]
MKKFVCMAMAAMLSVGAVPAYAADWVKYDKAETEYTFTAKAGTTDFRKNGEKQPLDVPVYIKDGYIMLPLRTFMKAVDPDATMVWHNDAKLAEVKLGGWKFSFDVNGNRIWGGMELLQTSGKMEVKDGRVFVPLRNWGEILNHYGYVVKDNDIRWDSAAQTATIRAIDINLVDGAEPFLLRGKGEMVEYSLKPSGIYDFIQSVGDGYFLAKKYVNDKGNLRGHPASPYNWQGDWFLLDAKGSVLQKYSSEEVFGVKDQKEGYLLVEKRNGTDIVIDREGNVQFEMPYLEMTDFSDGLAMVLHDNEEAENLDIGYINTKGELVIAFQFYAGDDFSEGVAAAAVHYPATSRPQTLYGYINTQGEWVIEPQYFFAGEFRDGVAKVTLNGRVGYIDKEGNEIVKPRYDWGSDFYEGKAFVKEKDGRVFLIDTTGKQLKQVTDGQHIGSFSDGILKQTVYESVADGNVKSVDLYFDENGQISYEEARLRAGLSEGLAAMYDEETGKYGYVNEAGEWSIAPSFDRATDFEGSYA